MNKIKEEMAKLPSIVAVDFDGTLCRDCYPNIGQPFTHTIEDIKRMQKAGWKVILWTCRDGSHLAEAIAWCVKQGLLFDEVNRNIKEVRDMFQNDTRKVYADLYVDDKSRGTHIPAIYSGAPIEIY